MNAQQFTNARVHEWMTPELDRAVKGMRTTRVQLNSAALWWFCTKLETQQRAEILGEYVKALALATTANEPNDSESNGESIGFDDTSMNGSGADSDSDHSDGTNGTPTKPPGKRGRKPKAVG